MRVGDLLVEAKLTESDFQSARMELIERYRDLEEVFDVAELPVRGGRVMGYQLIRGTLAAHASGSSFCVLCDARQAGAGGDVVCGDAGGAERLSCAAG